MTKSKRPNKHRIVFDMHEDIYNFLKEICDAKGMTVTKYITRAVAARLKLESMDQLKEING